MSGSRDSSSHSHKCSLDCMFLHCPCAVCFLFLREQICPVGSTPQLWVPFSCRRSVAIIDGSPTWRMVRDDDDEMNPASMVYNQKCATGQAQRRGVKQSARPYTCLFYPYIRATELGMRAEPAWNIDGPELALRSPWQHTTDDPNRHVVQSKVCNRSGLPLWGKRGCWPIHRAIISTSYFAVLTQRPQKTRATTHAITRAPTSFRAIAPVLALAITQLERDNTAR